MDGEERNRPHRSGRGIDFLVRSPKMVLPTGSTNFTREAEVTPIFQRFKRLLHTAFHSGDVFSEKFFLTAGKSAMDDAAQIRHSVFCEEKGWETVRGEGRETDPYDPHSVPIVLKLRSDGRAIACIRLISGTNHALPIEAITNATVSRNRRNVAEVSRLAVISDFRKRKKENGTVHVDGYFDPTGGRFPYIPVGIYLGMMRAAQICGIEDLYFLVDPALFRSLSRLGASPKIIGDPVQYRGRRLPCYISVSDTVGNLPWWSRSVWKRVRAQMDEDSANLRLFFISRA